MGSSAKKAPPQAGGAFIRNIMKKGGRNGGPLRIEDLDEEVLKSRLKKLDEELNDYKTNKKENDWYREEIETCQKDTADYIAYLESKKSEKLDAINQLTESNKNDMEMFLIKRKKREEENLAKINSLKDMIMEQELKLSAKESEIMQLSDTMARRAKHDAEIAKIRKEMQASESEHLAKMAELERTLLETRMRLQKEAEAKIKSMESAAHEKAAKYLADHTTALEAENSRLERELRHITLVTQQQIQQKERLEQENRELEREQRLRRDLVGIRLKKIHEAQDAQSAAKDRQRHMLAAQNKRVVAQSLKAKGMAALGSTSMPGSSAMLLASGGAPGSPDAAKVHGHGDSHGAGVASLLRDLPKLSVGATPAPPLVGMHQHESMWFDEDDEYGH
nr:hypothetical protein HK105_004395 [Polyrhizophydium stewartii]